MSQADPDSSHGPERSWQREARELSARKPRHLLFLCVANSARSQMAEALARSLAPTETRISSAGSLPKHVHPVAIRVLSELGIDTEGQTSKGLDAIDLESVDAVITLCADEVCPLFPRRVQKLHWPLPDPAAEASEVAQVASFRAVRDQILERVSAIFPEAPSA